MPQPQLNLAQQLALCQQIASLVRAKLPISGELSRATKQASRSISESAQSVDERITQGQSLADAIAGDPSRDSRILAACIESGEKAGQLDKALESWTEMHLANAKSSRELRTAMLYPTILIAVTLLSLGYVAWRLIPEYRNTYALFSQDLPDWLEAIVQVREHVGPFMGILLLLAVLPLAFWYWKRRRLDRHGIPCDAVRRMRLQALTTELASHMLEAGMPLTELTLLCSRAAGVPPSEAQAAFGLLGRQSPIPGLAKETSLLLATLHCGLLTPQQTTRQLAAVAASLRQNAGLMASRQAHWVPMLVALVVGVLTILTYVFLIYLPWILLLRQISAPPSLSY